MRHLGATVFLVLASCSHLTFSRSESPLPLGETKIFRLNSFVFGAIPAAKIPPESEVCPKARIESIDMNMSGQDVTLSLVTIGIYVPHRVTITCSKELN
jgi:hypothetical protein